MTGVTYVKGCVIDVEEDGSALVLYQISSRTAVSGSIRFKEWGMDEQGFWLSARAVEKLRTEGQMLESVAVVTMNFDYPTAWKVGTRWHTIKGEDVTAEVERTFSKYAPRFHHELLRYTFDEAYDEAYTVTAEFKTGGGVQVYLYTGVAEDDGWRIENLPSGKFPEDIVTFAHKVKALFR